MDKFAFWMRSTPRFSVPLHNMVVWMLLPLALCLETAANIDYIYNSSQFFPPDKFSLKKKDFSLNLLDSKSNSDHVEEKLLTAAFASMGWKSQGPCFVPYWCTALLGHSKVGHLVCLCQQRWYGGHLESGKSSAWPFWKTAFQEDQSGIGQGWITGSDYSLGIFAFGQAEAQVKAAAGPQWVVGDQDCWACCPVQGLLCCKPPVMQCLGLSGVFGSWLVIPMSEPVPIVHLDPKVTLLTLRSASLTLRQQNHGHNWEPIFFHSRGQSGLGRERGRWSSGWSQSRCCEKINKAFEEYSAIHRIRSGNACWK